MTPGGLIFYTTNTHTIQRFAPSGVVTQIAGVANQPGYRDGPGAQALFLSPQGIVVDPAGTIFVADTYNHVIRKITPDGMVSTLAGRGGYEGAVDGVGDTARFRGPSRLALDAHGNLYVSEESGGAIRRVTPQGVVTTFAGNKTQSGTVDGIASVARFNPNAAALLATTDGYLYVLESNRTLRRVAPDGSVVTVAGLANAAVGSVDGVGSTARFGQPYALAQAVDGTILVGDGNQIRRIVPAGFPLAPLITEQPQSATGVVGGSITLSVTASGTPTPSYSWRKNGGIITSASGPTLTLNNLTAADAADYTVVISNNLNSVTSAVATLMIQAAPTNDAFASRETLTGTTPSVSQSFLGATRESGEPVHQVGGNGGSLWWTWTAPANGFVTVDATMALSGTVAKIYTGASVATLTPVAPAPAYAPTNSASRVTFAVVAGTAYHLALESPVIVTTPSGLARFSLGYAYVVAPIAGNSSSWYGGAGTADGTGADARFNNAFGIVRDSSGNFFISDNSANTIRKMTPAGVVTTFAGTAGNYNYTNGTGAAAAFRQPQGIAIDASNNLYVADAWNHSIRKITSAGVVTLLAGGASETNSGFVNATGAAARFNFPGSVAVDASGNVYVADSNNHVIRRVTAAGAVTTYAGSGTAGTVDGTGTAAQLNFPTSLAIRGTTLSFTQNGNIGTVLRAINLSNAAVTTLIPDGVHLPYSSRVQAIDAAGNTYLTVSNYNSQILRVSPQGVISAIVGRTGGGEVYVDGDGLQAVFRESFGLVIDPSENLWFTALHSVRRAQPTSLAIAPVLMTAPVARTVAVGTPVTLSVRAYGGPTVNYQWRKNNVPISGANGPDLVFSSAQMSDSASYTVDVSNASGSLTPPAVDLTVLPLPANDNFAAATTLTGATATSASYNYSATRESGEPVLHVAADGRTLWWKWTAPHDGMIVADTAGSEILNSLGVFSGSALGSLTQLGTGASGNNANPSIGLIGDAARVYVNVLAGVTYHFLVDTYQATQGVLRLNVTYAYTVTNFVGTTSTSGITDGTGADARFSSPTAITRDASGNFYVTDGVRTIRKITPEGVVTTLAGQAFQSGSVDGTGSAARFDDPFGIALDPAGNLYVTEGNTHVIRKITPAGVVTTFAGTASASGATDGTGAAARFNRPQGIAYGSDGALYVADMNNYVIRRVTLGGVVTTIAGTAGQGGSVDGIGAAARFGSPSAITASNDGKLFVYDSNFRRIRRIDVATAAVTTFVGNPSYSLAVDGVGTGVGFGGVLGLAIDSTGNLFLTDNNYVVRRISPDGVSTTLAGVRFQSGSTLGTGSAARFSSPRGITVAPDGTLYVVDATLHVVRRLTPSFVSQPPVVQSVPANQVVLAGAAVTFTVGYIGAPTPQFVWRRNGSIVATNSTGTLTLAAAQLGDAGTYTVELTNSGGNTTSSAWTLGVTALSVNNNFADRISLTGATVQTTGNNFSASSEQGEPLHFEGEANRSVWWSWTAPVDSYMTADTIGSAITAMVAVYTGNSLTNLVSLGSGFDRVSFAAVAGQTYHIAVDGRAGATGAINLRLQPAYLAVPAAGTLGFSPLAVTQDALGNAWFTSSDHTIRRIAATGEITLVAGAAGTSGSADGVGGVARFNAPGGITRAANGTLYISDTNNHTIRRIATDGTVTTIAGLAGSSGNATGIGSVARFSGPGGLTLDAAGENLYIADSNNRMIRKLELATGNVTNFSGSGAGATSSIHDGTATGARFSYPTDIALSSDGNFYVTDRNMYAIRRVSSNGTVTTIAGTRFTSGDADGVAGVARFYQPTNLTAEPSGTLLVSDQHGVRRVTMAGEIVTVLGMVNTSGLANGLGDQARFNTARGLSFGPNGGFLVDSGNQRLMRIHLGSAALKPIIMQGLTSRSVFTGDSATFSVTALGVPTGMTYVWTRNNTPISGANGPTLTLTNLATTATGDYRVTVSNSAGSTESAAATLTVSERPANDYFANAIQLTGHAPSFVGSNGGASRETGEPVILGVPGGASLWWRWTAPASGAVIADTAGSSVSMLLAVYTGNSLENLTLAASARAPLPISVGAVPRSTAVMFTAVEGTTYWIAVDGENGFTGAVVLHLSFTYNFSTLAGLAGSSGTTNGVGSAARFNRLNAVVPDAAGNVYVADLNNHAIRKIAPNGTVTTLAGLPGTSGYTNATGTAARFNNPGGIVIGTDGNIYVADGNNHAIRRVTPAGVVTTFAGATTAVTGTTDATGTAARFNGPAALAVDAAGNFYVAEFGNHAIRKISSGAVVTTVAGLKGTAGSVNGNGTNARFNTPEGVAVDATGNVYVADFGNHAIRKIAPNGDVTTVAGQLGISPANGNVDGAAAVSRLNGPNGVTALPDGSLLVADYWNHALRKITATGYVLTLAGGNGAGHENGTGLGIKFNGPSQIAFGADGRLYVADQSNHVVRRGIITSAPSAPEITRQPQAVRIIADSNITLTSAAIGNPFPTYQWRKGNVSISGATTGTLTLTNVQPSDSGNYTLVATNTHGTATSEIAVVEILPLTSNDTFNRRTTILGDTNAFAAYNFSATAQSGEPAIAGAPASKSVWFTWTAPASGDVTFDTIGSTFDTRLAVFRGDTLAKLALVGENASETGMKFSRVRFAVKAGDVFQIAVDGVNGASGDFRLTFVYNFAFAQHAGTINTIGSTNGTLAQSRFNSPIAMASDATGNLYIADADNHVIRRITPAGVVSTIAGTAGAAGSTNATGASARFNRPFGIVADKLGNLFVADTSNHTIRKIVISTAAVTTLAGTAGSTGTTDATGAAALFNTPVNLAVDAANNLYVSDYNNRTIRKITQTGVVTTFAGTPATVGNLPRYFSTPWGVAVDAAGNVFVSDRADIRKIAPDGTASYFVGNANGIEGYADGVGAVARFNRPSQLSIDSAGNLYVADQLNHVIRQVTPSGEVRTLGGNAGTPGHLNGTANDAYFGHPTGLVIDAGGFLYVGSSSMHIITVGLRQAGPRAPLIATQPVNQSVAAGSSASFVVVAAGLPAPTYQWRKNGTPISGQTSPVLTLNNVAAGDVANYDVVITNGNGSATSALAALSLATAPTNDAFANASTLSGLSASVTAFSTSATAENGEPAHAGQAAARSLWWSWTAPGNGAVIAETTGSAFDTRLAIYTGASLGTLTLVGENDDALAGGASRVQFNATSGTTYRFAVDVNGAGNGAVRLSVDFALVATTFAGTADSSGTTNATGAAARFNNPFGTARDSAGNLYVADSANHTIRKITPAGVVTTFAGSPGVAGSADGTGAAARFNTPTGVAVDIVGRVVVADLGNHTIRRITPEGVVTTVAGTAGVAGSVDGTGAAARFNSPLDVTTGPVLNGGGTIYVTDFGNHTVRKITTAGVVTTLAGTAGATGFVDGTGAAARFDGPRGPTTDAAENLYLADFNNNTIRKITTTGVVTTVAGFPGSAGSADGAATSARFWAPADVAMHAPSGALLVAEIGNKSVRRISTSGIVSTIAGGVLTTHADGTAFQAGFVNPIGIEFDASGVGFVVDYNNHTIRKLTPANLLPAPQTITFAALADRAFTANAITLSATSSSGLPVSFAVVSGPATLNGASLTLTGTGVVTVRATQAGNSSYLAAPAVDRSFTVSVGFEAWLVERFDAAQRADTQLTGPNADFDRDGLSNFVEYALGLDPKVADSNRATEVTATAGDWTFVYQRPADRSEVTYVVEVSTNLTTWTTVGVVHERTATGTTETWRARYPLSSATQAFFRLKVSRP